MASRCWAIISQFLLATDLSNKLRLQAITDQLTDVSNRRGFLQVAW